MPIDPELSRYSDLSFGSSITVYLLALAFLLVEFASLRAASTTQRRVRELAAVGAGSSRGADSGISGGPGRVVEAPKRGLGERFGRMGVALIVLGLGLNITSLVLRGLSAHRAPWGNMYEFMSLMCAFAVLCWLVVLRKQAVRPLSVFVLVPVILLMFLAGTVLYARSAPVVPALRSYWLVIHVSVISTSTGVMLVSGVASLMFLLRRRQPEGAEHNSTLGRFAQRLPSAASLDRVAYRTAIFGFPLFTAGVILGAIWAEAAWGRFWGWDPKETTAFIAWVLYAAYLHARATAGWRNTRAAWINVLGLVAMMFNLFFINVVVSGLHSYAGLN
jgi:cytochrome c-type biogenesis protein CcsB